jgi:hypothetical protein
MADEPAFHDQLNDVVRIDRVEEMDSHLAVATMRFFRRLGIPHLYSERIAPTLEGGDSQVFLAARDRPWPPWGLGARSIGALCQVHPVSKSTYALSPVYTAEEDATNVGLIAAVYKETLEELSRTGGAEVSYLVVEGSRFADRLLRGVGFQPSEDLQVTDQAKYRLYRVEAGKLAAALGLDKVSVPELLAHKLDDATLDRLSSYFSGLHLATGQGRFTDRVVYEIGWVDGGLFDANLPGGVPPSSPTALPREGFSPPDASPPGEFARTAGAPPDAFPPGEFARSAGSPSPPPDDFSRTAGSPSPPPDDFSGTAGSPSPPPDDFSPPGDQGVRSE